MQKFIKVQKAPAKRGSIVAIILTGTYLKAHDLDLSDSV